MAEDAKAALEVLERAMVLEQEGRSFYLQAAKTTQDENGKETFTNLADDEQTHFQLIKRQHDSLTSDKKWVSSPEVRAVTVDLDKPLFPKGKEALEKAITKKSSDWDALLFGLDIESRSFDFYRKAASDTADPQGKSMFEFLAGEEMEHFNILMMRYEALFGYGVTGAQPQG
jgi:rubrerythrin